MEKHIYAWAQCLFYRGDPRACLLGPRRGWSKRSRERLRKARRHCRPGRLSEVVRLLDGEDADRLRMADKKKPHVMYFCWCCRRLEVAKSACCGCRDVLSTSFKTLLPPPPPLLPLSCDIHCDDINSGLNCTHPIAKIIRAHGLQYLTKSPKLHM